LTALLGAEGKATENRPSGGPNSSGPEVLVVLDAGEEAVVVGVRLPCDALVVFELHPARAMPTTPISATMRNDLTIELSRSNEGAL